MKIHKREYIDDKGNAHKSLSDGVIITSISFQTGEERKPIVVPVDGYSELVSNKLLTHGLAQKLGDSYAKKDLTIDEAKENLQELYASLQNGEWNLPASGGLQLTTMAKGMVYDGKHDDVDSALAYLRACSPDQLQRFRNSPKLKIAMAKVRLDKAREALAAQADDVDPIDTL